MSLPLFRSAISPHLPLFAGQKRRGRLKLTSLHHGSGTFCPINNNKYWKYSLIFLVIVAVIANRHPFIHPSIHPLNRVSSKLTFSCPILSFSQCTCSREDYWHEHFHFFHTRGRNQSFQHIHSGWTLLLVRVHIGHMLLQVSATDWWH